MKLHWLWLSLVTPSFFLQAQECSELLQHTPRMLTSSNTTNLCTAHKNDVLLIVNTASECGFTKQFTGLESLYKKNKEQGFAILGFPSNDFFQEHKDEKKTAEVCFSNYGVSFPMFAMGSVSGSKAQLLYQQLAEQSGVSPKWNFYKYLIGRDGKVKAVFAATTKPDDEKLLTAIAHEIAQPVSTAK